VTENKTDKVWFPDRFAYELMDKPPAIVVGMVKATGMTRKELLKDWGDAIVWHGQRKDNPPHLSYTAALALWRGAMTSPFWQAMALSQKINPKKIEGNAATLRRIRACFHFLAEQLDE